MVGAPEPISSPFKLLPSPQGRMEKGKKAGKKDKNNIRAQRRFLSVLSESNAPCPGLLSSWPCGLKENIVMVDRRSGGQIWFLYRKGRSVPWDMRNSAPRVREKPGARTEPATQGRTPLHPPPGAPQRESVGRGFPPLQHDCSREQGGQHPRTQKMPLCSQAS